MNNNKKLGKQLLTQCTLITVFTLTLEQELPSGLRVKQQQTALTSAPKVQPFWSPWQVENNLFLATKTVEKSRQFGNPYARTVACQGLVL